MYMLAVASDGTTAGIAGGPPGLHRILSAEENSRLELERSKHEAIVRQMTSEHLTSSAQLASDLAIVEGRLAPAARRIEELEGWVAERDAALSKSHSEVGRLHAELAIANASVSNRIKDLALRHGRQLARVYAKGSFVLSRGRA